jgi:uncharacterized surface protein with fasciclin (FAS1) repeats
MQISKARAYTFVIALCSLFCVLTLGFTNAAAARPALNSQNAAKDILATLKSHPELSTLVRAIEIVHFEQILANASQVTLFAPSNAAFEKWDASELDDLLNHPAALETFLEFHASNERFSGKDLESMDYAEMINGGLVSIDFDGKSLLVNDATIVNRDIPVQNGFIHVIDTLLEP